MKKTKGRKSRWTVPFKERAKYCLSLGDPGFEQIGSPLHRRRR